MKSKTKIALSLIVALALVAVIGYQADAKKKMKMPASITVQGILIDAKCYGMSQNNAGNDHMTPKGNIPNCASACARMGIPVGVLEGGKKGAKVYLLVSPSKGYANYMTKEVRVTGPETFPGAITPMKVEVKEKGKWKEIKVGAMM